MSYYSTLIQGFENLNNRNNRVSINIFDDSIDSFGCLVTVPKRNYQEYCEILRD